MQALPDSPAMGAGAVTPQTSHRGDPSISCYLHEIPPFIEAELAQLYETLHSSLPFFEIYRSTEHASCYISRRDGRAETIFVFALRGTRIDILNEMIEVGREEIERFARYAFAQFREVDIIRFRALKAGVRGFGFPVQQYGSKETYCISLPATPDAYTAGLGKSTRAGIHRSANRVRRTFPSLRVEYRTGDAIDESELREIMRLSEAKINAGGVRVVHDADKITAMARRCGFVTVLLIDGRVCAGWINYRVGANYFSDVMGYDRRYEKFGLGTLCGYHTIRECIARGGKRFYLGGGVFDYKERLLGRPLGMDELMIYRSRWKMLLNLPHAAGTVLDARIRQWKKLLHRHKKKVLAKLVFDCFYRLKNRGAKSSMPRTAEQDRG